MSGANLAHSRQPAGRIPRALRAQLIRRLLGAVAAIYRQIEVAPPAQEPPFCERKRPSWKCTWRGNITNAVTRLRRWSHAQAVTTPE